MTFNILRFKGKSTDERFNELEEEGRKKKIEDERARLEGKLVQASPAKNNDSSKIEGGLAVALETVVFVLDLNTKEARQVATRRGWVYALAFHNTMLYDSWLDFELNHGEISNTLLDNVISEKSVPLSALVSYQGNLYGAGHDCGVSDVLTGIKQFERKGPIHALAVHDGKLYDAGSYKQVICSPFNQQVAQRTDTICALASHNGRLYDAGADCKIFDTLSNKEIARRWQEISALASHEGKLYDAGNECKIFDTFSDPEGKKPIIKFKYPITALCSLPQPIFEALWNKGEDV
jgi:hypothetical protein